MKKFRKIASFMLCMVMLFAMSATALAAPLNGARGVEFPGDDTTYDDENITLWNHTDVIMRSQPNTSSSKVHTLYIGDMVYCYNWQVSQYMTNGHHWAYVRHYDREINNNLFGYCAQDLLS